MSTLNAALPGVRGRFSLPYAAVVAGLIEAALMAVLVFGLPQHRVTVRAAQAAVMLSFPVIAETPPKPTAKTVVQPPPKTPTPRPKPKPVSHVVKQPPAVKPPPPSAVAVAATPPPKTVAVAQATPSQASVSPDVMSVFEQQVHAAIQAALVYPYAARIAHIEGRVKVSFSYRDGRVTDIKIVQASEYAMFNTSAQQAVMRASYPAPPANLTGRQIQFELWVRFDQVNTAAQ